LHRGAGISRFTSLLDSLSSGFFDQPEFVPILERDLAEGQHRNPTDNPNYFTDAFFHLPDELAGELADAGFELIELVAVEGPGWLRLSPADATFRSSGSDCSLCCGEWNTTGLIGASSHLLAIGRRR
jgi:hypothetical protein